MINVFPKSSQRLSVKDLIHIHHKMIDIPIPNKTYIVAQ